MKVALLIPPRGFKDESLAEAKKELEKWHVEPVISCYTNGECIGYHGATYKTGVNAAMLNPEEFDALLLVDGEGVDSYKLYDFRPLLDTVKLFNSSRRIVAGIGNAVKIIARANVISDTRIAHPNIEEVNRLVRLYKGIDSKSYLEFDKNILTLSVPEIEKVNEFASMLVEKMGVK